MKRGLQKRVLSASLAAVVALSGIQFPIAAKAASANVYKTDAERKKVAFSSNKTKDGYEMSNGFFKVATGKYGQITSLQIVDDLYPTNYVLNTENAYQQNTASHQWMGELMFKTKVGDAANWKESMTSKSDSARKVELKDNQVVVTYENATETKGINDFKLVESYTLEDEELKWNITVENTNASTLEIGDFGMPLAFNEYWPGGEEIYETRVVDHTFIGKNGSYIYATRPSGLGQFLLMTPEVDTGAGFEYQDHWRVEERSADEKAWCQDQNGWASGLSVYYIHSKVIQSTGRGYYDNTSLVLEPGESKTYGFSFHIADDEADMKSTLYQKGMIDAVAIPGMTFSKDMPAKMYLHADYDAKDIEVSVKCPHELNLFDGLRNSVNNELGCEKTSENTKVSYVETKKIDGEKYHIYDLSFGDMGQNDVVVRYDGDKETELQFYIMDSVVDALNTHSDFMVEKTQWNAKGEVYDQVFDDWMMDTKKKRGVFDGYWGWGDDWGLTHGEFIAEKNVFVPVAKEIKALDSYLNVAVWNGLMQEHQEDYLIHDFQMPEPNTTPTYRGYAYPHIYNTYYSMYKIATKYPDMVDYIEDADTYLLRAYNIMKALYSDGVAYNWETGVMGELTTPDIILSLKNEGYYDEAREIESIMTKKYNNFKNTKYPYGSEYSYDNTGEEAVYTLAKLNLANDTANANKMMRKIDAKTRACRGLQPVWYHYANPTTICGESWWNFQYTAALAGYCMDDYLRLEDNGYNAKERALAERMNYAAKLANLTCINSGQIDADKDNIGTVAWTYQSELGHLGGQGTGGGALHNGWRQMAGEADLGLFGVLQILSADVAHDPVFGLFGYGCEVEENKNAYIVTPLDGLQTRLQFIDEQLYITLDRDQYTKAEVAKDSTGLKLQMKNLEKTAHTTQIDITGLSDGNYDILVDGKVTGSFTASHTKTATIAVPLPATKAAEVEVKAGGQKKNTAPIVSAGADKKVFLPSCDGIEAATISVDINLSAGQTNNTRVFEFGDMEDQYFYVSFENGNKLTVVATDGRTGKNHKLDTGVKLAPDYWKTLTLTVDDGKIAFYVDGQYIDEMDDTGFGFKNFSEVQRNYLGRSHEESIAFFNGMISNFEMYAYAMTKEEVSKIYGDGSLSEIQSVNEISLVTGVGKPVKFPEKVSALYGDGIYQEVSVTWDEVDSALYDEKGNFDVEGHVVDSTLSTVAHVYVVDGEIVNLASAATATAIIDTPNDLGGVKGLNDEYDPSSSRDTSHGVWHNWHGDQNGEAWVQYTWDEEVILTGQDAYYFTDGNFAPADVALFYQNKDGEWISMEECEGLGVELNCYNTTTFQPVSTKAIKMVMNPKTLGVGVIEWKVYGYQAEGMVNKSELKELLRWIENVPASAFDKPIENEAVALLKDAIDNAELTADELKEVMDKLNKALEEIRPKDGNYAYIANVETSYVSGWESLDAVNDGELPKSSTEKTVDAYGSWGNDSSYETITYSFPMKVSLDASSIYFWTDGGGIIFPKSYRYEYLDGDDWKKVQNADGYELEADQFNVTTFDQIKTKAIRVTINKQEHDGNGVGVFEWSLKKEKVEDHDEILKDAEPQTVEESTEELTEEETETGTEEQSEEEGTTEDEEESEPVSQSEASENDEDESAEVEKDKEEPVSEEDNNAEENEFVSIIRIVVEDMFRATSEGTEREVLILEKPDEEGTVVEVEANGVEETASNEAASRESECLKEESENVVENAKTESQQHKIEMTPGIAKTRLHASVVDDGYPTMNLSYEWSVSKSPEGAEVVFEHSNKPITNVTLNKVGKYELMLTVNDGELQGTDTIVVTVSEDEAIPEKIAEYNFSKGTIDDDARILKDANGTGYDAKIAYNPEAVFKQIDERDVLVMTSDFCGYIKLDSILTKGKVSEEKTESDGDKTDESNESGKTDDKPSENPDDGKADGEPSQNPDDGDKKDTTESGKTEDGKHENTSSSTEKKHKHESHSETKVNPVNEVKTDKIQADTLQSVEDTVTPLADTATVSETVKENRTSQKATSISPKVAEIKTVEEMVTSDIASAAAGSVEKEVTNTVDDKKEVDRKQKEEAEQEKAIQEEKTIEPEATPATAEITAAQQNHTYFVYIVATAAVLALGGIVMLLVRKRKIMK